MRLRSFIISPLLFALAFLTVFPQASAQIPTDIKALRSLSERKNGRSKAKKSEAVRWAQKYRHPVRQINRNGQTVELMRLESGHPVYNITDNSGAARTTRANELFPGGLLGLSLTGYKLPLGVWDGGFVDKSHREFTGRVTWYPTPGESISVGDHATHVAGTLISRGISDTDSASFRSRGMSYLGSLRSYEWNNDTAEMALAAATGLRLSNHSYGTLSGWHPELNANNTLKRWIWYGDPSVSSVEDYTFGIYDGTAAEWDEVAYRAPYYLIVRSAGNDRGEGPSNQPTGFYFKDGQLVPNTVRRNMDGESSGFGISSGYDTLPTNSTSKNVLTIGAVYKEDTSTPRAMSTFSGWGPTDDGRIKPDLVAAGVDLYSTLPGNRYGQMSGTSMASPNAAGSLALLIEHWRKTFPGQPDMRSATLKALAIHTAQDLGRPGPDYEYGWGCLNVSDAAKTITAGKNGSATIIENTMGSWSNEKFISFKMNPGETGKATLVWTDPPGTPSSPSLDSPDLKLINDIDMIVYRPDGLSYPFVLDPNNPDQQATTGRNERDNVEQVVFGGPDSPGGNYFINLNVAVSRRTPQPYSLIITGQASRVPTVLQVEDLSTSSKLLLRAKLLRRDNSAPVIGRYVNLYVDGETYDQVMTDQNGVAYFSPDMTYLPTGSKVIVDVLFPGDSEYNAAQSYFTKYLAPTHVLFMNESTRAMGAWIMNGATVAGWMGIPSPSPGWTVKGYADFNADSAPDILWMNESTRDMGVWYHTASGYTWSGIKNKPSLGYTFQGIGDFNEDGWPDILWMSNYNGSLGAWKMQGTTVLGWSSLGSPIPAGWVIRGVADFNQDGRSDLFLYNTSNRLFSILFFEDAVTDWVYLRTASPDYALQGIGDFNMDGQPDILFMNSTSRSLGAWLMDGTNIKGWINIPTKPSPGWSIKGIAYSTP